MDVAAPAAFGWCLLLISYSAQQPRIQFCSLDGSRADSQEASLSTATLAVDVTGCVAAILQMRLQDQ